MTKPIIGILGRVDIDQDNDQAFVSYEKSRLAIIRSGGVPILLLPTQNVKYYECLNSEIPMLTTEEKSDLCRQLDLCDGLFIPGGYRWFVNYDVFLTKTAIQRDMPVLGICAGMQMLGTIYSEEQIIVKNETKIEHYQRKVKHVHEVEIFPHTKLFDIVQRNQMNVNSVHHYHLEKAPGYQISAKSEDGLIEGIELSNKNYVIGVQWHPETMIDYEKSAEGILTSFIKAAESYQKRS